MRKRNGCLIFFALFFVADIGLALIYPQIAVWYAQLDIRRVCANIPENTQVVVQNPLLEFSVETSITPITIQNASQLVGITDIERLQVSQSRYNNHILTHPSIKYRIYVNSPGSAPVYIYICDANDNLLKIFLRDETARVQFSSDYTMFAVYEARFGNIELYNVESLESVATIDVQEGKYTAVWSIAFHPTEPILTFTREVHESDIFELYLWDIKTNQLIDAIEINKIYDDTLTFNADGTLLYFTDAEDGHVWGIPAND